MRFLVRLCSLVVSLAVVVSILGACGKSVDSDIATNYSAMAEEAIVQLINQDYEALTAKFDAQMKAALTIDKLKEIEPVLAAAGEYVNVDKSTVQEKDGLYITVSVVKFAKKAHIVTITFNGSNEIAGLFIQ